jgi:two-component system, OmpR family, sensor kinase
MVALPPRWQNRPWSRLRSHDLPLRLRLALLSAVLLGATLVVFSVAVYLTLAQALTAEIDRALIDRARVLVSATAVTATESGVSVEIPNLNAIAAGGTLVQVVALDGKVLARSRPLGPLSLHVSPEALASAGAGKTHMERLPLNGMEGISVRQYTVPLVVARAPRAMLQVARPVGPIDDALARLRLTLAGGVAASIGLCAAVGLVLARAALRPIDRLTSEAEEIGTAQDFTRRVVVPGASRNDEVGRLACTFNGMLERLHAAYEQVAASLDSQRRFVADASHELRTPLTTVRGNAELLRCGRQLEPVDREAAVEQIASEAERMSRLINDLLTLARADAGQQLTFRPVALEPLVEWAAQQGRTLAQGALKIEVIGWRAPLLVMADPDALRQLLLILVDNAVKYTPPGGRVILALHGDLPIAGQVGTTAGGSAGPGRAQISVADTGVGIALEDLPLVFDRFYRADRARSSSGTGLGLAIGRWIAQAHGGSLAVESTPGQGSIFTVTLPVYAGYPELSPADESVGASASAAAAAELAVVAA